MKSPVSLRHFADLAKGWIWGSVWVASGFMGLPAAAEAAHSPRAAATFEPFAPRVKLRWDEKFLYVEDNGLPAHGMMVGITAWQQQVPLPQPYFGDNAWQIPLQPVPAKAVKLIKGHFLRGAIALAANGIPIFNPQNNRGEVSQEIGELDQWGGHCGRADDYHYHAAPFHLQALVGEGKPIAYALDGYPIYGLTEPDGSALGQLDECNGHESSSFGYHYHGSTAYPYVIGGFHGEVVEREGQVDPQPRAQALRQDQAPLAGAKITGFKAATDEKTFSLEYTVSGKSGVVNYRTLGGGAWKFQFVDTDGRSHEEIYCLGERPKGGGGPRQDGSPPAGNPHQGRPGPPAQNFLSVQSVSTKPIGALVLHSPEVVDGGNLPEEFTGDGASSTLPLDWSGAPSGTVSYALIMHHIDPEGVAKWYWTLYDIPANLTSLPKNVKDVGTLGAGFKGQIGYEAPHSKGPGAKTYTLTLYALSAPAKITVPPGQVNREVLLTAIRGRILASAELNVVYSSKGAGGNPPARPAGGNRQPKIENPGWKPQPNLDLTETPLK